MDVTSQYKINRDNNETYLNKYRTNSFYVNGVVVSGEKNVNKIKKLYEKNPKPSDRAIYKTLDSISVEDKEYIHNPQHKKFNKKKANQNLEMFFGVLTGAVIILQLIDKNRKKHSITTFTKNCLKAISQFVVPLSIFNYYFEKGLPQAEYKSINGRSGHHGIGASASNEGIKELVKDIKKIFQNWKLIVGFYGYNSQRKY